MAGAPQDVQTYLDKITSEHNKKPNYMAMLEVFLQPFADAVGVAQQISVIYDLDTAQGEQLDAIGEWVGATRQLNIPITGVYFTFDTGPGFDIGIFKGPFDPSTGIVSLPDQQYRTLLKATVAANHWDGSVPGAYAAYAILFQGTPFDVLIYDYQDMTMGYALLGGVPDAITEALFTGGYLSLKPEGVRIRSYAVPAVPGPVFAFDLPPTELVAGFDVGAFAKIITP